jgi:hypothetical protein
MKAFSVSPQTQEVKELDIVLEANTVYSFFNSILIDELGVIDKHMIYTDAEAISKGEKPFFIGEQLLVGEALIVGKNGIEDSEAIIPKEDLASLVNYDVSAFYIEVLELLQPTDINLYRVFELSKNGEDIQLNTEWVLYVFNIADERTQEYFKVELQKAIELDVNILEHMQKMAQLALNATQQQ